MTQATLTTEDTIKCLAAAGYTARFHCGAVQWTVNGKHFQVRGDHQCKISEKNLAIMLAASKR